MESVALDLTRASLTPFSLPLASQVRTGRGAVRSRRGILLEIVDSGGMKGWGEATPMDGFGTERFQEAWESLEQFLPVLLGSKECSMGRTVRQFRSAFPAATAALSAIDTALCDLSARQHGCSVATLLSREFLTDAASSLSVNALLIAQDVHGIVAEAGEKLRQGFQTFKIKVGVQSVEEDLARVSGVRNALGDEVKIRLDANGSWTREEAVRALQLLSPFGIEYIEQPLPAWDLSGSACLRGEQPVLLAADESVCSDEDMKKVLKHQAADLIILKPAAGGPHQAMQMGEYGARSAVPCITTTLMDGAVGRAMAAHVAAALRSFQPSFACGLATGDLFTADFSDGLKIEYGKIFPADAAGLGVDIDPTRLTEVASGQTVEFVR